MRASALHILDEADRDEADRDADLGKVNGIEAPLGVGPEIIPGTWTPEHVGKRLIEAFETLAKLPPLRGPKIPGNAWPQHVYDWEDKLSQATLSSAEQRSRERARNRVPPRATGEELRRMEIVLGWLSDLAKDDVDLCRVLQRWSHLRSLPGRSIKEACRRAGLSHQAFYRLRDKGIAAIAARLAGTPVW